MHFRGWTIALASGTLFALLLAGLAQDSAFRAHMGVLTVVLGLATLVVMRLPARQATADGGYFDAPIRYGSILTIFWGIVGMLVGVVIALQLAYPDLNFGPWFSFGRLRPLHTSAVIFAFGGNALIDHELLCGAAHLPRPAVRRQPRLVRLLGLPALHRHGGDRLPARHHPGAANMPSPNGMSISG